LPSARDKARKMHYGTYQSQLLRKHDMAEHKPGSMDTKVQEKTFANFIRFVIWGTAITLGTLVFLALANG
jgi:hypothetical protein